MATRKLQVSGSYQVVRIRRTVLEIHRVPADSLETAIAQAMTRDADESITLAVQVVASVPPIVSRSIGREYGQDYGGRNEPTPTWDR